MTDVVHLHIGEPKTGTTSIQATLTQHADALAAGGLLVPGGRRDQIKAAQEVMGRTDVPAGGWAALAEQVAGYSGTAAVISMESLVRAQPAQIRAAVAAFDGVPVQVVLSVRDLARVIPAQWQESLQFGHTWTYEEYLDGVTHRNPRKTQAGRSFWSQHDTEKILIQWGDVVGADRLAVVTVPTSSASGNLWQRFAAALGIDAERYPEVRPTNESLGAASAELMRRINETVRDRPADKRTYATMMRGLLAKRLLAQRRGHEAKVVLPTRLNAWLEQRRVAMRDAVVASGATVYGDLADLMTPLPTASDDEPSSTTDADVAAAAVDGIVALLESRSLRDLGDPSQYG